ncbi:MAG: hypothetical protein ACPGVB_02715 [Chitinophagales bacterium]
MEEWNEGGGYCGDYGIGGGESEEDFGGIKITAMNHTRIFLNLLLYIVFFIALFCVFSLGGTRNNFLVVLISFSILTIFLIIFTIAELINWRCKVYERSTIWSKNLQWIFGINLLLVLGLWFFASLSSDGLWRMKQVSVVNILGNGYLELSRCFHNSFALIGMLISILSFYNIKYRIYQTNYRKILLDLIPVALFCLLVYYHFYCIPQPQPFNG